MKPHDLFLPLVFLNILAVLAGIWYYADQLAYTPASLLIFVPDCPLYAFLFILLALGLVKNDAFAFLVSAGMIKYGLWTSFILLFHWNFYSIPAFFPITVLFIIGHFGMAAEGLAILPKKRIWVGWLILIIGWLLLNDFIDYSIGTLAPIPREGLGAVAALTVAASFLIPLALFFFGNMLQSIPGIPFLRSIIVFREQEAAAG